MAMLYQLSYNGRRSLPVTYSGTEQVLIRVRTGSSGPGLAILCDLEEDLVFTIKLARVLGPIFG